jgi:hypothetical protein
MRKDEFPKVVTQLELTTAGLLVRGAFSTNSDTGRLSWHPYVALLDPATGATRWNTDDWKPRLEARSDFVVHGSTVIVATPEGFATLNLTTGAVLKTTRRPPFQGGDEASRLERADDGGLLLRSSQNIQRIGPDGTLLYSRYFKAPTDGFWSNVGSIVLVIGLAAATAATINSDHLYFPYFPSSLYRPARYKGTIASERFVYILTSDPSSAGREGISVVRIDVATGTEAGRVWFMNRPPTYRIDVLTGIVTWVDGHTVRAQSFIRP